jgi:hypothetical protein
MRLLGTRNRSAYFAMAASAAEVLATPLDWMLSPFESRIYEKAPPRRDPIVFVVGPPRSGTTICEQTLLSGLPVAYLNNVTSIFPRSPLLACRVLGGPREDYSDRSNYYGKTFGLRAPNDALYIWDRWLGPDRTAIPDHIDRAAAAAMRKFFDACAAQFKRPILNKVNNLVASAHLVNHVLENCYFICLSREPLYLAQSLYQARVELTGDLHRPYGLLHDRFANESDPIKSVCEQVRFYRELAEKQQASIGNDRFWIVSYEQFCQAPQELVQRVGQEILRLEPAQIGQVAPIEVHNRSRLSGPLLAALRQELSRGEDSAFENARPS